MRTSIHSAIQAKAARAGCVKKSQRPRAIEIAQAASVTWFAVTPKACSHLTRGLSSA